MLTGVSRRGPVPLKVIFIVAAVLFAVFLIMPMAIILIKSLVGDSGFSLGFYADILTRENFGAAFRNSVLVSAAAGILTTVLAFILAYAVNYTNINKTIKKLISVLAVVPMLLPTITYGFAIIYSFGKQGLITMLFGRQFFDIYGVPGLMIGYVIYTLPIAFMLINNTMQYIDKKFMIVSRAMGDSKLRCFVTTVITPLLGTFAASFIQSFTLSFTLSFTDYGIPTSVAGNLDLVANLLYNEMLGSLPNFNTGSAVAITMLLPSVISIMLLTYLERYNIRYNKISVIDLEKNRARDILFGTVSSVIIILMLSIFAVIFVVPFVEQWPYRLTPSFEHAGEILGDPSLMSVFGHSLFTSSLTAVFGTVVVFGTAVISARRGVDKKFGRVFDSISLVTNTIPGMVLGVAYLLAFSGTPIQNTFFIIIVCNIIHFFSSPYLMMKNGLEKLNASWETTAKLMGDSWIKTIVRIIIPNSFSTIAEVFEYYFINAMVTVSAVIFIAGARTMVITAKIKELQHFANFNEIFVLSILILLTNLVMKGIIYILSNKKINKLRTR